MRLSDLAHEFFANNTLMNFPILALLIFVAIFSTVAVRVFRSSKASFEEVSRLPLDGNDSEMKR